MSQLFRFPGSFKEKQNTSEKYEEGFSVSRRQQFLGPLQGRMTAFMEESKKEQTLYANCEGAYERRMVDINDPAGRDHLHRFISCTLCNKENSCLPLLATEKDLVERISTEMIKISRRFNTTPQVYFSVVWVFYYSYRENEIGKTPLFKLYTNKCSPKAIFLDVLSKTYDGWDFYLENADLPKSFICVPRQGAYRFHPASESLDLIYVFSPSKTSSSLCKMPAGGKFTPFCNVVVRPLFTKIKHLRSVDVDFIKKFVSSTIVLLKNRNTWIKILGLVSLALEVYQLKTSNFMHPDSTSNITYMLLNISKILNLKQHATVANEAISPVSHEFSNVLNLLSAPKKNWDAIFCSFAEICKSGLHNETLASIPNFPVVLKILSVTFEFILCVKSALEHKENSLNSPSAGKILPSEIIREDMLVSRDSPIHHSKMAEQLPTDLKEGFSVLMGKIGGQASKETGSTQSDGIAFQNPGILTIVDDSFPGEVHVLTSENQKRFQEKWGGFKCSPRNEIVFDFTDDAARVQVTLFRVNETLAFAYTPSKTVVPGSD